MEMEKRSLETKATSRQHILNQQRGAAQTYSCENRYFGRAKDLPGVRELFEADVPEPVKKSRYEMIKSVDADYYGYRDEDDGILVAVEAEEEKRGKNAPFERLGNR
jgi:hypothetical protein